MICLGLEATAHTFGVGIISNKGTILADVKDMYTSSTGIIPGEAAKHHKAVYHSLIKQALETANQKIDLVSFSHGPGIGPCLHTGKNAALEYAKILECPVIGVNHPAAHLTIGQLMTKVKDPLFLYLSGANTQVIAIEDKHFRIMGETLDIGIGNALDKFGRVIGLGFPAGPKIEELARKGSYVELPYVVKGMDASFSGIITKCEKLFRGGASKEDLCFSLQETLFAMVTEIAERALAHTRKKELILIGGVGANQRLAGMLTMMCEDRGCVFKAVPSKYCTDNGVMIAWQGVLEYQAGRRDKTLEIKPYERIDEVEVIWDMKQPEER